MIALAPHAVLPASLFNMLATAEVPAAMAKIAAGSPFQSMLQTLTESGEANQAPTEPQWTTASAIALNIFGNNHTPGQNDEEHPGAASTLPPAANASSLAKTVAAQVADKAPTTVTALSARRTALPQITLNIFRTSHVSDHVRAENPEVLPTGADAAPQQKAATRPIALHIFRASHALDQNEGENSEVRSKLRAAQDADARPETKPSVPVPPQAAAIRPNTLNIFRTNHISARNRAENPEAPSRSRTAADADVHVEAKPNVPVPPQPAATRPIMLKLFPNSPDSDQNDAEHSEAASGLQTVDANGAPQPEHAVSVPAQQTTASRASDQGDVEHSKATSTLQTVAAPAGRPKSSPDKKDYIAENIGITVVPGPPQPSTTLPITLNTFPTSYALDESDGDNAATPPPANERAAPKKIAEASAPLQAGFWGKSRIEIEEPVASSQAISPSATETQPDPDRLPSVAATCADGSLSRLEPVFEARLAPETPEPMATAASGQSENSRSAKDNTQGPAATIQEATPNIPQSAPSGSRHGDNSHHPAQDQPQDQAAAGPLPDAGAGIKFNENAPMPSMASTATESRTPSRPEAPAPAVAAPELSTPAAAATTPAAHEIKLELNGGGQRVELRVTDRGGDIHVAVRTPDARLSGAMREDLPALAAKLEQSGFRADMWQPGAAAGGERRPLETGAASASHDSQEHARQDQQRKQDNQQQQQPKNFTNAPNRKSERKDFAWLLQTYR